MMNPTGKLVRLAAILAVAAGALAPTAAAEQRHHRDNGRYDSRHHDNRHDARNNHRRDNREYRRHDRHDDWRDGHYDNRRHDGKARRHDHAHYKRHDSYYNHHWSRADRYYNNHHYAHKPTQVVVTRNVYRTPHVRYDPRWHIGQRYHYSPRTVVIRNPHHYGLYAPPRGHHWVHDDDRGDAILASVATGAIIGLVIGVIATN